MKVRHQHELTCINEYWISDNEVIIEMECNSCESKFTGKLREL